MSIQNIIAYIERQNSVMYRNHGHSDRIDGFVCEALANLDNSNARLLLSYLEDGKDAKARELLIGLLEKEYGDDADEFAREQAEIARDQYMRAVANG